MTATERLQPARARRPALLESLVDRVQALRRFVDVTTAYLPERATARARVVIDRAGERLSLSREHTVVALAGATGSGKSSLFNAIAGVDLSAVGLRRPTTGTAHACVWGDARAGELLDWLGVPPSRRFGPAQVIGADSSHRRDDEALRGLVLLDLPDIDSVEETHHVEVDRILALVDLMVWVLDPQKYADRVVHKQYLSQFSRHREVTVVVLNQSDLLRPDDVERCLEDLRRLVTDDGLKEVPVIATSAVGPPGLGPLSAIVERAVATRQATLRRLAGDVADVVADLAPLVQAGEGSTVDSVDAAAVNALTDALTAAAGVPVVARATERAYVHRAVRTTGWPMMRWLRRLRPDPLSRLHLGTRPAKKFQSSVEAGPAAATSIMPAAPALQAAVGLALRALGQRAGERLPAPWPAAILDAARSHMDELPDTLDLAIARTDLGMSRPPRWWSVIGVLQWALAFTTLLGLVWLAARYVLSALALPQLPTPHAGRTPLPTLMFLGGLLGGLLVSTIIRPIIRIAARRKGLRASRRMRSAVATVARTMVIGPVEDVCRAYGDARTALRAAR
jgi:energy-coupling factor transporter ATP-binding protein EcfA2